MKCQMCGKENPESADYCEECGTSLRLGVVNNNQSQNNYNNQNNYSDQNSYNNQNNYSSPSNYGGQGGYGNNYGTGYKEYDKPITAWGYVGYMLLFSIPCVGIILMFIYAFGNGTNINLKNFARAYLILMAIGIVLSIFINIFVLSMFSGAAMQGSPEIFGRTSL